ncbi:MAG: alpha/beta hydrolase [Rivularia sp. (in: cyanobacteria)]
MDFTDFTDFIIDYELPITDYRLPITDYRLPTNNYHIRITLSLAIIITD